MNTLPRDYEERVYAGVLGKIIGVYLGRPFEGWHNQKIEDELGEVWYYVHEKLNKPLVVSDDDISGTFTFLRALPDHGYGADTLTAQQIGQTWLNYLIEKRTVLWWGGMGMSTEHTAYLRLKNGVPAPLSGSIETNGKVVAEQIGAQIFIDGWAMVCPGDPDKAASLALRAASVSHDGEAIYGAQVIAVMESLAFVEPSIATLIATAATFIPPGSLVYQLIGDLQAWHAADPLDWRAGFRKIEEKYGYDKYGGNCHTIPNHAVILLALLYGADDFQKSLMIANTAGWDTDCNSGNVGCLLGIKNGLAGIDKGADFRGPVADRMYLPTADGGRAITDAVRETFEIVNIARQMQGQHCLAPKHGMRFHFDLPGAVQGFMAEDSTECRNVVRAENVVREGEGSGNHRMLALHYAGVAPGRAGRVATATFTPAGTSAKTVYSLVASPTLYAGQTVRARVVASDTNRRPALVSLFVRVHGRDDVLQIVRGPAEKLPAGESHNFHWQIPATGGQPVAEVGIEVSGASGEGTLFLDWLSWNGAPDVLLGRPANAGAGEAWQRAWVNAVDQFQTRGAWNGLTYKLIQDGGMGQILQGESTWCDYTVSTQASPHLADTIGLIANACGLRRHVALTVGRDSVARLIERYDDDESVLAHAPLAWELDRTYEMTITSRRDGAVSAVANGVSLSGYVAPDRARGAIGLLVCEGHGQFGDVRIVPATE